MLFTRDDEDDDNVSCDDTNEPGKDQQHAHAESLAKPNKGKEPPSVQQDMVDYIAWLNG